MLQSLCLFPSAARVSKERASNEAQLNRLFTVYDIPHLPGPQIVSLSTSESIDDLKGQIVRKVFTAQGVSIRRSQFRLKMDGVHVPFGRDLSSVNETYTSSGRLDCCFPICKDAQRRNH